MVSRGTGWDLHEWRHSGLTHLGKGGASLLMLMAKSRHKNAEDVAGLTCPSEAGRDRWAGAAARGPFLIDFTRKKSTGLPALYRSHRMNQAS